MKQTLEMLEAKMNILGEKIENLNSKISELRNCKDETLSKESLKKQEKIYIAERKGLQEGLKSLKDVYEFAELQLQLMD